MAVLLAMLLVALGLAEPGTRSLGPVEGWPFERYETVTEDGARVLWYLSEPVGGRAEGDDVPLVMWVQGSGFGSHFQERGERVVLVSGASAALRACEGRARLLLVEKAGTAYLDTPERPGSAEGSPLAFREGHTLENWSGAIETALRAAWELEGVSRERTLVAGHSEGGIVAAAIAARVPEVTHVGVLSGGGPTQLYSLIRLARAGAFGNPSWSPEEAEAWIVRGWERVQNAPDSAEAMFMGHPHRRWSSLVATSPVEQLRQTDAAVFIAQGTEDTAAPI